MPKQQELLQTDTLIIGAGVMGLTLAQETLRRAPKTRMLIVEKESDVGFHASGRNSGVLHAGFYYTADSLKARFCVEGNRAWKAFVQRHGLSINPCGKLVLAHDASELEPLQELHRRGLKNGVDVRLISEAEAHAIEPRAKTHQMALWSPSTATVSPVQCMQALRKELEQQGVRFLFEAGYERLLETEPSPLIQLKDRRVRARHVINSAGTYADRIAHDFGVAPHLQLVPFKGLYLYGKPELEQLKTNLYPVPNLKNPFLGVHFTVTVDGKTKIGPTAIPALWREHYGGFERFDLGEFVETSWQALSLFWNAGFDFRSLALEEIKKHSRRYLVNCSRRMTDAFELDDFPKWGAPGIRAQLMDTRTKKLEMDFVAEHGKHSFHVLNSVSPAFTCAIPFAKWCVDQIEGSNSRRDEDSRLL